VLNIFSGQGLKKDGVVMVGRGSKGTYRDRIACSGVYGGKGVDAITDKIRRFASLNPYLFSIYSASFMYKIRTRNAGE
jgi:hypothetical protein